MIQASIGKQFPAARESAAFSLEVAFQAAKGITVLFGPSGAGKTLVLDCIAGFVRPESGRILVGDVLLFDAEAGVNRSPQQRRCGYVLQNYALFPHMTVRENLLFAAQNTGSVERHRRVGEMLERFRLTDVAGRRPHQLSGGQRQRCSLARSLVVVPRVLLLDEPARGLDAPLRSELYDILRHIREEFEIPILLVTHSLEECFELADEMFIFRDGRIVQNGTPCRSLRTPCITRHCTATRYVQHSARSRSGLSILHGTPASCALANTICKREYFPGHFKGDHVHLLVTPKQLRARPRDIHNSSRNSVPAELERTVHVPDGVRLEFLGGLQVEVAREAYTQTREWTIEFPSQGLRIL